MKKANELLLGQIDERKRVEEKLLISQAELRDLAIHLQSVKEAERTTIAREIHRMWLHVEKYVMMKLPLDMKKSAKCWVA